MSLGPFSLRAGFYLEFVYLIFLIGDKRWTGELFSLLALRLVFALILVFGTLMVSPLATVVCVKATCDLDC